MTANDVAWAYETDYEGTKVTVTFKGTLEAGTSIKGKVETAGTSGNFTAQKQ